MRVPPVDVIQRRFDSKQAEQYAADLDFQKLGWPVVNHRDGIYWIVDGQHRIAALKLVGLGDENLDCEVYEGLRDDEMAHIFLGRDDRRRIDNYTKFMVACTARHVVETEVRDTVLEQGLKISRRRDPGCVGAVSALLKVHRSAGRPVLAQVLRTIRDAYAADAGAFDGTVIEGIGLVFNRFNGRTNEHELASRLSRTHLGVRGLLQRAESLRERTGNLKVQCIAATVVDIYNTGIRAANRLPSWWKTGEVAHAEDSRR